MAELRASGGTLSDADARVQAIGGSRSPRVHVRMTSWRLTRWLLFYLAMMLAGAAVVVAVVGV